MVRAKDAATGAKLLWELLDALSLLLRDQAKLRGLEGMILRHRFFRAMQAVENQLPEIRKAYLAVHRDMLLALVIDQVHVVAFFVATDLDVLT